MAERSTGGFRVIQRIATGQYNLPAILTAPAATHDLDREVGGRLTLPHLATLSMIGRIRCS
jgi:hypothetical protein